MLLPLIAAMVMCTGAGAGAGAVLVIRTALLLVLLGYSVQPHGIIGIGMQQGSGKLQRRKTDPTLRRLAAYLRSGQGEWLVVRLR